MSAAGLPSNTDPYDEVAMDPPDNRPSVAVLDPDPDSDEGKLSFAEIREVGEEDKKGAWIEIDKKNALTELESYQ